MLIQTIKLHEILIEEINGVYEATEKNHEVCPAMLTNYAIEQGHRQGLIKSSLVSDLFALYGSYKDHGGNMAQAESGAIRDIPEGMVSEMGSLLDETKMTAVIYMGCIGANKAFKYSYDEFLERYHADVSEKMQTYVNLISGLSVNDKNAFAAEFRNKTQDSKSKKK